MQFRKSHPHDGKKISEAVLWAQERVFSGGERMESKAVKTKLKNTFYPIENVLLKVV